MVDISISRPRGRPLGFDPDEALDRAAELFWRHGYEGTDIDSIARSVGVTKPSLYRLFGGKAQIFERALARYGATIGAAPVTAFHAASDTRSAVRAFLTVAVEGNTNAGLPTGCLLACSAAGVAESQPSVRDFYAAALEGTASLIAKAFDKAVSDGGLPADFPSARRSRLLVDLMQANALRARAGEPRHKLADEIEHQVTLIVGP